MVNPESNHALKGSGQKGPKAEEADNSTSDICQCSVFESGVEPSSSLITQSFCPAAAIAKLPYKYLHGEKSKTVGKRFFDQDQFWQRKWDLHYIYPPADLSPSPLLLLLASQVQQLLQDINQELNISLTLPVSPDIGLLLPFAEDGTPQPQYLGQSSSRETKDRLMAVIPKPSNEINDHDAIGDGSSLKHSEPTKAFRAKMEAGLDASKNKSKISKEKKRLEKIDRQREWAQSLKRAQCYLGLHPHRSSHPDAAHQTIDRSVSEGQSTTLITPLILQLDQPAPFPFAYEPIFVSIDVESNERRHREITEIGISTLDTLDLVGMAPGQDGENWIRRVRSRHIRIKESAHIVNHVYVSGCPSRFGFGESEFISFKDACNAVEACFKPPYSAQVPVKFVERKLYGEKANVTIETEIKECKLRPRNIVLLGHGVQADIEYLHQLGCNLFGDHHAFHKTKAFQCHRKNDPQDADPRLLDTLDTANLFQVLKREAQQRALEIILNSLSIVGWNLHNAGNDARYTLEAMVRIIINSRLALNNDVGLPKGDLKDWAMASPKTSVERESDTCSEKASTSRDIAWKAEVERRVAETVADSEMRVREDCKIWEIVTGWDSEHPLSADDFDGGEPKGMVLPKQRQKSFNNDYKNFEKHNTSFKRGY
ncbi:hypothetical protein BGW36DRAFT_302862 [Talaromyces proteolyticus]|uniref:Gfd2/YDR514C-like C-terminal domain-containing protein n=1 Tax=Talaromyces proteolyticus TaxID=1131652 RepID=A0AAD4PUX3_9EURO|nr:uncharacterized protein BGW36DRAFT_302862 [Talaromyces proteolyticus]KAH8692729.1 hypothetical protein BGW36DRAFT_302862 [Talaromyces proteolyticus]